MSSDLWERTKEILKQALRLAPEERQAYLDAACGADASLRSEVESLIASHEEAGTQFLDAAAPEVLQLATPRALASGTKLGPYKIIELLGIGGMGEVYRAKDTRLERTVAINLRTMIGNEAQDAIRVRMKQIIPEYAYTPAAPWAESSTSMMLASVGGERRLERLRLCKSTFQDLACFTRLKPQSTKVESCLSFSSAAAFWSDLVGCLLRSTCLSRDKLKTL
jgi:hypothetical protein